jgi:aminopeptidase N
LWNALSAASGRDIGAIASSWIQQPGFPLVSVTASCDAEGKRSVALEQHRFLLQGKDATASQWDVPLVIRSGANGAPHTQLLTQASQMLPAGRCGESLSLNAGTVGYYRVQYDAATLKINTEQFATLPDSDRIALLDDQWALVESGRSPLSNYLTLAASMGSDLDTRAWMQIVEALGTIEYDEHGRPGYEAFSTYARSLIKPVAQKLGWDSKPEETPGIQRLRRTILEDLGSWGDLEVIAEARRRFAAFVTDHHAIAPDDQNFVLGIVARNSDAATFEQLHAIAKAATTETEQRRYYQALMVVRDPKLAAQAAALAVSAEIPPQAAAVRLSLVNSVASESPQLAWTTLTQNLDMLMVPQGRYGPLIIAQFVPEGFWDAVPLDQLESWCRAHVPAEMTDNVSRGMESAHFMQDEKARLAEAADGYVRTR